MPDIQLSFAKIVANPTETAWSQAYNAGSLFGVLSLKTPQADPENMLNTLGKDVFTNLQTEFYSLEEKSLSTIKEALTKSYNHVPETVNISFCVAFIKQDILYLFLTGNGKVVIKRQGNVGTLLEKTAIATRDIATASGYLQNGDIIVLQTEQFASLVTHDQLVTALESTIPNEIAETVTPQIHQTPDGGASALILNFIGVPKVEQVPPLSATDPESIDTAPITPNFTPPPQPQPQPQSQPQSQPSEPSQATEALPDTPQRRLPQFHVSLPPMLQSLSKKQLIILGVVLLLLIMLIMGIFTVKHQQNTKQNQSLFTEVSTNAKKKFDEGEGLLELNKPLAKDSFTAAEGIIKDALPKFPKNSDEFKNLSILLGKIDTELAKTEGSVSTSTKEVAASESPLLLQLTKTKDAVAGIQSDNGISLLTPSAILTDGKELIRNSNDWSDGKSLGTFLGNFYVLDTKSGILKFSDSGSSFSKSSYFTSNAPDLSQSSGMAIDGSVWILYQNGSIEKYTKGAKDTFSIKNLSDSLVKPTSITTNADTQNLYILDPGSSRIVVIKKDGTFQTQYKADSIKTAQAMDIHEKDKKAFILSGGKVYELTL